MVSLWYLLTLISACLPVAGTIFAARYAHYGPGGYFFASVIGVMLGIGNFLLMRGVHQLFTDLERPAAWVLASIYAGAVLWAFISTALGYVVAPWLIDSVVH